MKPEQGNRSAAGDSAAFPAGGDSSETTAAEWIRRREVGLTASEREALRAWLAADARHAAAFARADAGRSELDWPLHAGAIDDLLAGLEARARRRRRRTVAATAALAVVLLAGLTWQWPRPAPVAENSSPAGIVVTPPARRILTDGSVIDLRDGAEIAVDDRGALRLVTLLRGTAHFQVAKNPGRPFVVRAAERTVRAVGTEFTVELGAGEMAVLVTEGTVAVGDHAPGGPGNAPVSPADANAPPAGPLALVNAGNLLVLDASSRLPTVHAMSAAEIERRLAWRLPRLEFSGVALGEVVAMFNRHNRTQIKVLDPSLTGLKLTGSLRADKLDALVQMLESDYHLQAVQGDHEIVLRRGP